MKISESLLPEFDREMANTRKSLERVPEDKFDWKPHEKSGTLGWLASHLATLPGFATFTIEKEFVDIAPPFKFPVGNSRSELLEIFDQSVSGARAAIAGASDEHLFMSWSLLMGGKPLFTMPRVAVLRSFMMNHIIHHRAQLGVYLRLNDIPVPSIYGPSADENQF
ncbi:MAG: DinB family protein [Pyrinomonadaceae bacterium]